MKRTILAVSAILIILAVVVAWPTTTAATPQTARRIPAGLHDYERWFGSLHAHTDMDGDDGVGTSAEAFSYVNNIPHLDFFALTPHLHFPTSTPPSLWSESTYDQIRLDAADLCETLVCFAGVELSTISSGGHFNYFGDVDLVDQEHTHGDWNDDDDYYDHIVERASLGYNVAGQFNHPEVGDFGDRYDAEADRYVGTIAVSNGYTNAYDQIFSNNGNNQQYSNPSRAYVERWGHYLNLGWHISPVADQDNHKATWGASSSEYTVIVRPRGTRLHVGNVLQGLRDHMTYATEDPNMAIGFTANGWSMGQVIGDCEEETHLVIWWDNPSETLYNGNTEIGIVEPPNDVIQTIWIYQNTFDAPVLTIYPGTTSGEVDVDLYSETGDWLVVVFQDSKTLATDTTYGRLATKDLTWSAPVWCEPSNADEPIMVEYELSTPASPTATPTPTPEKAAQTPQIPKESYIYFPIIDSKENQYTGGGVLRSNMPAPDNPPSNHDEKQYPFTFGWCGEMPWRHYAGSIVAGETVPGCPDCDLFVACTIINDVLRGISPCALYPGRWHGWKTARAEHIAAVDFASIVGACDEAKVPRCAYLGNLGDLRYWSYGLARNEVVHTVGVNGRFVACVLEDE